MTFINFSIHISIFITFCYSIVQTIVFVYIATRLSAYGGTIISMIFMNANQKCSPFFTWINQYTFLFVIINQIEICFMILHKIGHTQKSTFPRYTKRTSCVLIHIKNIYIFSFALLLGKAQQQ